jgi:hypothetical protein
VKVADEFDRSTFVLFDSLVRKEITITAKEIRDKQEEVK